MTSASVFGLELLPIVRQGRVDVETIGVHEILVY
jgi:hypothetical protein